MDFDVKVWEIIDQFRSIYFPDADWLTLQRFNRLAVSLIDESKRHENIELERLRAIIRINALRYIPNVSHEQIDNIIKGD